jgi:hypothetical protein
VDSSRRSQDGLLGVSFEVVSFVECRGLRTVVFEQSLDCRTLQIKTNSVPGGLNLLNAYENQIDSHVHTSNRRSTATLFTVCESLSETQCHNLEPFAVTEGTHMVTEMISTF